jgi:peptidoglycan/LPS O-acetylase OafA/YrhL
MHSGERWRLEHRPALDGLRGIAILLVLTCHVLDPLHPRAFHAVGSAGVIAFFTLSGFLITSLLLEEREGVATTTDLRRFYARRARRLLPGVAAAVAGTSALAWFIYGIVPTPWPTLLYSANWVQAFGQVLPFYGPTWSLSIEEQFYLLWPIVLIICLRKRHVLMVITVAGIVCSTIARFVLYDGGSGSLRVYYGTDTQASTLLVGCLLAVLAHRGLPPVREAWIVPAGVTALAGLVFVDIYAVGDVWVPTLVPYLVATMIWSACQNPGLLGWSILRYVGRRSYAVYLWHPTCLWVASSVVEYRPLASGLLGVMGTFVVAELSWRYVEAPFLRRRRQATLGVKMLGTRNEDPVTFQAVADS